MKAGQPHSSAEKPVTPSPAHITGLTVKQATGELKTGGFVEEKMNRKVQLNRLKENLDKELPVIIHIVSGSAAYGFFMAASAGLDIKL